LIGEEDKSRKNEQQKEQQQLQQREFSSIFAFKIIQKARRNRSLHSLQKNNNIDAFINLISSNGFKFESEAYESGFGKPTIFESNILMAPYYDIIEEEIIEDTTNKDKPGEIKQETKIQPTQKVRYIIDTNIFANEDLVFICRTEPFLDNAKQLLVEYLKTLQIYEDCSFGFVYDMHSEIMQQLLMSLYDYWPTSESQITSVRIGGKTISARYSGRGAYDIRLEDANEEIRNRISSNECIEDITLRAPIWLATRRNKSSRSSRSSKSRAIPKISISENGIINCRANVNYENFVLIKNFVQETMRIIKELQKGRRPIGYMQLDEFTVEPDKASLVGVSSSSSFTAIRNTDGVKS
jgi:hypothetical protein